MDIPYHLPRSLGQLARLSTMPEPSAHTMWDRFAPAVGPTGLVGCFGLDRDYYSEEPKWLIHRAELWPTTELSDGGYPGISAEGGRASTEASAGVAALFEAFERYSLSIYRRSRLVRATYATLAQGDASEVYDPARLTAADTFAERSTGEEFLWVDSWNISRETSVLIPAQLVYVPYLETAERLLRDPLTTGCAAGLSPAAAILRGLLEVLERDALMLAHYTKVPVHKLAPASLSPESRHMYRQAVRYGLIVELYQVDTDYPASVVFVVARDESGIGPPATFGSKASLDLDSAARGALDEAISYRRGLRFLLKSGQITVGDPVGEEKRLPRSLHERIAYWTRAEHLSTLQYLDSCDLLASPPKVHRPKDLLDFMSNLDIFLVDVNTPEVRSFGGSVVKVIVPDLQPMHLNEDMMCRTNRFLAYAEKYGIRSTDAHPFL